MRERVLIDNDVLLKIAAWRLEAALLETMTTRAGAPGMLGVARFVVRRRLGRREFADRAATAAAFERLCSAMVMLEPEPVEIALAAKFEEAATSAGLELDAGESLLLAVLITRDARLLLTGDKRAIAAIAGLGIAVDGQIASLEQIVRLFAQRIGVDALRSAICSEHGADTALSICFACHRDACPAEEIDAGLLSYGADIERTAGTILIAPADLIALAA